MSAMRATAENDGGSAPITVLHVDDDQSMLDITAEYLQRHNEGITVRTATDPRKALDGSLGDVDCVVSDYEMPGMDGVEFLKTVRRDHPSVPIILFTGKGSEAVASEAISAGVTDYLQKETGTEQYELLCQRIENAVARRRARTNYRELFEKLPVGLTIHDPDSGRITDTNAAFGEMLGYDPEELVEVHPGDLSPDGSPFTRENATRLIRQTVEEGTQTFEWQDETEDGEPIWVKVTLQQSSIDGRQRVLAVVQDITHRKEHERSLEHEKDQFEAIFEHSNDAIFVLNPATDDIINANRRAEELLGYDREELLSSVTISDIHPDHLDEFRAFLDRVREEGAGWTDEFCCVTKTGDEREAEISAATVEREGRPHLIANVRDVTERRERERDLQRVRERMEFVLQETDAVIWERDPETGEFTTHPDPCPALGGPIETAADLRAKVHPDDRPNVKEAMRTATETGESRRAEFRTAPDVEANWIETRIEPVTDEDGTVSRLAGLARDITVRKERERGLERQNERLEEFTSVVSHDLRNPLQVAEGRVTLAREECDSDHLLDVTDALDRMDSLLDDLLTLARHGTRANEMEAIDLASLIAGCWRTVETADATLAVDIEATVRADRSRLKQLFENLIDNAVQYGGDDVTVRVSDLEDGFYVEDDGTGIPPEDREQVFERGYTTAQEGTGFGLRIVKQIVEAHDWEITLTESADGGARFEITDLAFVE